MPSLSIVTDGEPVKLLVSITLAELDDESVSYRTRPLAIPIVALPHCEPNNSHLRGGVNPSTNKLDTLIERDDTFVPITSIYRTPFICSATQINLHRKL